MPSLDDIHGDLEADRRSRESEIRLVEGLANASQHEVERSMLRRSLILLTYAHLEGYAKFALYTYTTAINALKLSCAEAAVPIAAASLNRVFAALRNPESKHAYFNLRMPDDAKLHLSAREHVFVEDYERVVAQQVSIPDALVDTKSNLSPDVLRKLLFQLGLPYPKVDEHESAMNRLLGIRNAIAHGDRLMVPSETEIVKYLDLARDMMSFLQSEVHTALANFAYLRTRPAVGEVPGAVVA